MACVEHFILHPDQITKINEVCLSLPLLLFIYVLFYCIYILNSTIFHRCSHRRGNDNNHNSNNHHHGSDRTTWPSLTPCRESSSARAMLQRGTTSSSWIIECGVRAISTVCSPSLSLSSPLLSTLLLHLPIFLSYLFFLPFFPLFISEFIWWDHVMHIRIQINIFMRRAFLLVFIFMYSNHDFLMEKWRQQARDHDKARCGGKKVVREEEE